MTPTASRPAAGCDLLLLSAAAVLPIQSRAHGPFVGGSVGAAQQQDYDIGVPVATRDDTDTEFRLFGGYLVSPMQGVVASYVDLGTPYYDGPSFGGFTVSLDGYGVDVSFIAGWAPGDQQRVAVFGTVGVFHWNQDVTYTDASGTFEYGDDGTSFSVGFGAEINLSSGGTNAWGIHVSYQLFKDVGEAENSGAEHDRGMFSVGVDYRFGAE